MKKTALQKLIEHIDKYVVEQENHIVPRSESRIRTIKATAHWCKMFAENLLEEENQMVVDAYENGASEADDWHANPHGGAKSSKQYFNETYQQ